MGWLSDSIIEGYLSQFMLKYPRRGLFVASVVFDKMLANKQTLTKVSYTSLYDYFLIWLYFDNIYDMK